MKLNCRLAIVATLTLTFAAAPPVKAQHAETGDGDQLQFAKRGEETGEENPVNSSAQKGKLREAAQQIIQQTNQFRKKHGRSPVEADTKLTDTARYFAEYMARTASYGHYADGNRPAGRAADHGYEYCLVAENIAYYGTTAQVDAAGLADQFTQGWIDSPGHRENMLRRAVTQTGVAVAQDADSGYFFAVQMFGRPESASIRFTVSNRSSRAAGYVLIAKGGEKSFDLPARAVMTHTRCQPPEIRLPGTDGKPQAVDGGDAFVIQQDDAGLVLNREPPAASRKQR